MICAGCGETTSDDPCVVCGASPLLDGRYRLETPLGHGANGVTYGAIRLEDGAGVAIKELPLHRIHSPKAIELFHREARVLGELDHAGVPDFYEDFVVGTGKRKTLYIVQERIDGPNLGEEMARRRYSEAEVCGVIAGVSEILAYLHERTPPVIHRDLKPDNVIRTDERLVLVDFGSVRDALKEELGSTVTGTFGYMASEQYLGEAVPRSDVYGLGALAATLLTRKQPNEMLDHAQRLNWQEHTRVSPALSELLDAMLSLEPSQRPTAAEVGELVTRVLTDPEQRLGLNRQLPVPVSTTEVASSEVPQLPAVSRSPGLAMVLGEDPTIEIVVEIATRVDPEQLPDLVHVAEGITGLTGDPRILGDQLRWRSYGGGQNNPGRVVELSVRPLATGTEIRVRERCGNLAGGLYGGIGGGVGGGFGGGGIVVPIMFGGPIAVVAWLGAWVGGALLLARLIYVHIVRRRRQELNQLVHAIVERIEDGA